MLNDKENLNAGGNTQVHADSDSISRR